MLDISSIKHAKSVPTKTYFDLCFQTDNKNLRAGFFLKKNGNILYQEDNTGCVISSIVQDSNKTKRVLVKQIFTVKSKTPVFSNEANYQSNSLYEVINEFKLVDLVFVMVIIAHTGDINTPSNNLTLKE